MKTKLNALPALFFLVIAAACFSASVQAQAPIQKDINTGATRRPLHATFASSEDAVTGLVAAMRSNDRTLMHQILGPVADRCIQTKDEATEKEARANFLSGNDDKWLIKSKSDARAMLNVGNDDWPLPFPLVKRGG